MIKNGIKKGPFNVEQRMGKNINLSSAIISSNIIDSQDNINNENQIIIPSFSSSSSKENSPAIALLNCNALRALFNCSCSKERIESIEDEHLINSVDIGSSIIQLRVPEDLRMNVNYLHFIFLRSLWFNYQSGNDISHKALYETMPHVETKRQLNKANHFFIEKTMKGLQSIQFRVLHKNDTKFPEILGEKVQPDGWYSLNITDTKVTTKAGRPQPGYILGCPEVLEKILAIIDGKFNYFYFNPDLLQMSFYDATKEEYTSKRWIATNICVYDTLINRISFLKKDQEFSMNYITLEKFYHILETALATQINPREQREKTREIRETFAGYLEAFKQRGIISGYGFLKDKSNFIYDLKDSAVNLTRIKIWL